jgi:hypothetical protein
VIGKFRVLCHLDLSFFPLDYQACYFHFSSWTLDNSHLRLANGSDHINVINPDNTQWSITKTTVRVTNETIGDQTYDSLFYNVYIRRLPMYFFSTIVLPCIVLTLVALIMFCLPPDGGEKVSLGVTILLSFVVFQLLISDTLPRSSEEVPLLCKYSFLPKRSKSDHSYCSYFYVCRRDPDIDLTDLSHSRHQYGPLGNSDASFFQKSHIQCRCDACAEETT